MEKSRIVAVLVLVFCIAIIAPVAALAQAGPIDETGSPGSGIVPAQCQLSYRGNPGFPQSCTICHIGVLVLNLTRFLMSNIALPLAGLLFAAGGIILLTSGPSESQRTLGKKILTSTVWGFVIVMLAWLIVDTAIKVLTMRGAPGGPGVGLLDTLGPWNRVSADNCFAPSVPAPTQSNAPSQQSSNQQRAASLNAASQPTAGAVGAATFAEAAELAAHSADIASVGQERSFWMMASEFFAQTTNQRRRRQNAARAANRYAEAALQIAGATLTRVRGTDPMSEISRNIARRAQTTALASRRSELARMSPAEWVARSLSALLLAELSWEQDANISCSERPEACAAIRAGTLATVAAGYADYANLHPDTADGQTAAGVAVDLSDRAKNAADQAANTSNDPGVEASANDAKRDANEAVSVATAAGDRTPDDSEGFTGPNLDISPQVESLDATISGFVNDGFDPTTGGLDAKTTGLVDSAAVPASGFLDGRVGTADNNTTGIGSTDGAGSGFSGPADRDRSSQADTDPGSPASSGGRRASDVLGDIGGYVGGEAGRAVGQTVGGLLDQVHDLFAGYINHAMDIARSVFGGGENPAESGASNRGGELDPGGNFGGEGGAEGSRGGNSGGSGGYGSGGPESQGDYGGAEGAGGFGDGADTGGGDAGGADLGGGGSDAGGAGGAF